MNQECCASPPLAFPPLHLRATCHACAWCSASPAVHAGAGGVRRRDLLPVSPRMPSNVEEPGLVDVRVTIGRWMQWMQKDAKARPSAVIAGCHMNHAALVSSHMLVAPWALALKSITWLLSPLAGHWQPGPLGLRVASAGQVRQTQSPSPSRLNLRALPSFC